MAIPSELSTHNDLQAYISALEPYYFELMLGKRKERKLQEASDMLCGTLTALMACDLLSYFPQAHIFFLDGRGKRLTRAKGHRILGIELPLSPSYCFVDGTVFQLFPAEEHMRVGGPVHTAPQLLETLKLIYGGTWKHKEIHQVFHPSRFPVKVAQSCKKLIELHALR